MLQLKPIVYYIPRYKSEIISMAVDTMLNDPETFKPGHIAWVCDNMDIVEHFIKFADWQRIKLVKVGQRFICEFHRWQTELGELNCEFKVNNDNVALLAHLYNACPGRADYFRTRDIKNLKVPKGYETIQEIIQ